MIGTGLVRAALGDAPVAESAHYGVGPQQGTDHSGSWRCAFCALRAFSSGCTALTGVEAIANGVPAFRPPKARNAQITLAMMGAHRHHDVRRNHRAGPHFGRARGREPV